MPSMDAWEQPLSRKLSRAAATMAVRFCSIRAAFGLSADHFFMVCFLTFWISIKMRFAAATTHRPVKRTAKAKHHKAKLNLQRPFPHLRKRTLYYKENTSMAIEKQNESRPRVLILG